MHRTLFPSHRTVIPESPHRHSRVGLSGIYLDLGLQQPEPPGQHGFPLRACGNDEVAEPAGMTRAARRAGVESPHRHSRVGLSGIYLDLGLQQPETRGQHGFPLRACGNDEVADLWE
ncbi:hypothetical protein ACTXKF_10145 [Vreelandella alkaliphila]|uniref:hypothetical protein n=1 Tax=Halomonadaceae TaxID=28256 RepID=UPI001865B2CD|nr:hypothetical protein [Halomonas sp. FME65]